MARREALALCEGLRRDPYRAIVHVPPATVLRLREILARRRHVVRLQSGQVCAVKALLRGAGRGHAASYAGIVPATCQSGDRDAHGRITMATGWVVGTSLALAYSVAGSATLGHLGVPRLADADLPRCITVPLRLGDVQSLEPPGRGSDPSRRCS